MTIYRKPIGYSQLDLSNKINERLAFAFAFRGPGDYRDLSSKSSRMLPIGSATVITPTLIGHATRYDGTANSTYVLSDQPLVTSDGVWTGDFTMAVLSNPISESNARHNLGPRREAGNFPQAVMGANLNTALTGATAGAFTCGVFNNPNYGIVNTHSSSVDGNWHLWVWIRRGTAGDLWRDGALVHSTTGTAYAISDSSTVLGIGQRPVSVSPFICNHHMALAIGWNRALSSAEALQFSQNPWQILRQRPIWLNVKAAPAAAVATANVVQNYRYRRIAA
jgi:hypothetical protein